MEFLPDFGLDAGNRRYHDETTAPEPYRAFKAKVALAAIRGEQTLVELSQQFDVHGNQIKQWKGQILEGVTGVFSDDAKAEPVASPVDLKTLHAKIGELTLENDFLSGALCKAGLLSGKNDQPRAQSVRCPPGEASRLQSWGIEAIYRRPNTSKPAPGHKVYPYLLRKLAVTRPNQVWAMDISYVPMARGFIYLCAVVDWFSRRVLS